MAGVVFVCVENAARGPLAEALSRHLAPHHDAWSAGSRPSHVHPEVRLALDEVGADPRGLRSKGLRDVPWSEIHLVVALCAEEVCPRPPGGQPLLAWPIPDPASAPREERLEAFRAARDEILRRLPALIDRLDRIDRLPSA